MNIKFGVIRLSSLVFPAVIFALSMVAALPVLNAEKADANAVKTVYFTFDDGPSSVTEEVLDILKKEGIKATFFVIGPADEKSEEMLFRIKSEGHSIGLHTMSHSYDKIYISAENFVADLLAEKAWVYSVTGIESRIFRFPGGSNNYTAPKWLIEEVKTKTAEMGMTWFDWNADGKDSLGEVISAEEIAENVLSSEFIDSEKVIVLLHDSATRKTTPKALEILIEEFKNIGYVFEKLE